MKKKVLAWIITFVTAFTAIASFPEFESVVYADSVEEDPHEGDFEEDMVTGMPDADVNHDGGDTEDAVLDEGDYESKNVCFLDDTSRTGE